MDRIIEYIISALTTGVKPSRSIAQIYHGDPFIIPENSLPCIIVDGVSEEIRTLTSEEDQRIFTVEIRVIYDARRKANKSATTFSAKKEVEKIIGEANTDMSPKDTTILDVIRDVVDDNHTYVVKADVTGVNYQVTVARNYPTIEGTVTVVLTSIKYLRG